MNDFGINPAVTEGCTAFLEFSFEFFSLRLTSYALSLTPYALKLSTLNLSDYIQQTEFYRKIMPFLRNFPQNVVSKDPNLPTVRPLHFAD